MKDIDQEIDLFENNLNQINDLKNQISNLKTSLERELKEVNIIEEIKNNINQELQNIKIVNESNKKVIEKQNMLEKKLLITNIIVIVGFILTIMLNLIFR